MYFFTKNKFKIIIAAVTLVLILIMAVSSVGGGKIPIVSNAVSFVVSPIQRAFGNVYSGVAGFFSIIGSNKNYARENEELRKTVASLENEVRRNDSLISENNRLRQLLELSEKNDKYDYIAADIIAADMTNWSKTFTANKGLVDGVTKNCTVVTPEGLVGYVYEVGRNWSKIVTIIDSSVSVSAKITRLNVNAVVSGDMTLQNEERCAMKYLSKDINAETGDYAVTAGNGGIYPEGLYIGRIVDLHDDVSGLSQEAVIEPGVNFIDLSEVMIIKK